MFSFREKDSVLSSSWPPLSGWPWPQWIINCIYSFPFLMLITVILKFELAVELPGEFTKHRFLSPTSSVLIQLVWGPKNLHFEVSQGIWCCYFGYYNLSIIDLQHLPALLQWQFPFSHLQAGLPSGLVGKKSCDAGDMGLIPGSGRSPREGNGYLLQYSCLKKSHE